MDFSSAQRAAHAEEYADAVITTMPSFSMLDKEAQDLQRKKLVEEAQATQVGCETHFWRSGIRVKKNGALVPPELVHIFDNRVRQLLSRDTTPEQFTETVNALKIVFPKIVPWINWWLRPAIASMIFPARSVVDPALVAKVPSTTNAIEHQHSLLHHATGTDMDLIPGAENIWLHVRELEKQYEAIKGILCPSSVLANTHRAGSFQVVILLQRLYVGTGRLDLLSGRRTMTGHPIRPPHWERYSLKYQQKYQKW